jgi:hypothetical protein
MMPYREHPEACSHLPNRLPVVITVAWVLLISHRSVSLRLWNRDAVFDSREILDVGDGKGEAFANREGNFCLQHRKE